MKVSREGNRSIMMNVMMGLKSGLLGPFMDVTKKGAYEYHSHAEYSVLISRESVLSPL